MPNEYAKERDLQELKDRGAFTMPDGSDIQHDDEQQAPPNVEGVQVTLSIGEAGFLCNQMRDLARKSHGAKGRYGRAILKAVEEGMK